MDWIICRFHYNTDCGTSHIDCCGHLFHVQSFHWPRWTSYHTVRKIAAVFVLSCCVFTQVAIIGKYLTTLITAVNFFIITLVVGGEIPIAVGTDLPSAALQGGRANEARRLCAASQGLRCGWGRGFRQLILQMAFPMLHSYVLPQPLLRNVGVVTMFAGKLGHSYIFNWRIHSWEGLPFLQEEFLSPPGIPPLCWRACLLVHHKCSPCLAPGVQGVGEGGAHVEGEVKWEALAGQCLAKFHALGVGQGEVNFTRLSHFDVTSELWKSRNFLKTLQCSLQTTHELSQTVNKYQLWKGEIYILRKKE